MYCCTKQEAQLLCRRGICLQRRNRQNRCVAGSDAGCYHYNMPGRRKPKRKYMSASFLKSRTTLYGALLFFIAQILDFIMQLVHASERARAGKPLPENFTGLGISWEVFLIFFAGAIALLIWRLYSGRSRMRRGNLYLLINVLLCIWGVILAARSIGEIELFDLILVLDAMTYVTALIIPCVLLQLSDRTRLVPEEWKLLVPAVVTILFVGLSVFSSIVIIRASSAAGDYSIWLDLSHLLQRAAVALFAVSGILKAVRIHRTYAPGVSKLTEVEEAYWDRVTTAHIGKTTRTEEDPGILPETGEEEQGDISEESMTECPSCGKMIPESLDRCPYCGTELFSADSISAMLEKTTERKAAYGTAGISEDNPETEEQGEIAELPDGPMTECPSCGKMIPESVDQCPYCGTEFFSAADISVLLEKTSGRGTRVTDQTTDEEPEQQLNEPDELPEGPITECPGCGRMISESLDHCPHCGAELISTENMRALLQKKRGWTAKDAEGSFSSAEVKQEPAETKRTVSELPTEKMSPCPNCGKWIPDRLDKCPHCGAEFFRAGESYYRPDEEIRLFD